MPGTRVCKTGLLYAGTRQAVCCAGQFSGGFGHLAFQVLVEQVEQAGLALGGQNGAHIYCVDSEALCC